MGIYQFWVVLEHHLKLLVNNSSINSKGYQLISYLYHMAHCSLDN